MLRQKQTDQKEIQELKYRIERDANINSTILSENEQLRLRVEQMQMRFLEQERVIDN